MSQIAVTKCPIEGLYIIEPTVHGDERGNFFEVYNERDLKENGIEFKFVQENQSFSMKGVLRGLHYQKQFPQTKLARVTQGTVFDVAVDLRPESLTYKSWYGVELSESNHKQFLIPAGFAHGLLVLSDTATFVYKCTDFYHPEDETGIAWNDPEIGVEWPGIEKVDGSAVYELVNGSYRTPIQLSEKDKAWPEFAKRGIG